MAEQTIYTSYTQQELETFFTNCISDVFKKEVASLLAPSEPQKQILTRQETATLLNISLPTLHTYTKLSYIPAFRLGHKVRYKRIDVENSLQLIKTNKN